jgi:MoaA/NifB/PqqE/SkfB family radical SAM enzyme
VPQRREWARRARSRARASRCECPAHGRREFLASRNGADFERYDRFRLATLLDGALCADPPKRFFFITPVRNQGCHYCLNEANQYAYFDAYDLGRFEADVRALPGEHVSVVGGEPLSHPRFFEFVEIVRRHGKKLLVYTNGLAFADEALVERLRSYWTELVRMKQQGLPIASSLDYLRAQAEWPDFCVSAVWDPSVRCAAGRGFLFVDPLGNASPCTYQRGRAPAVNLLAESWKTAWNREAMCTRCNVGPMLEFNLLYKHPIRAALNVLRSYA